MNNRKSLTLMIVLLFALSIHSPAQAAPLPQTLPTISIIYTIPNTSVTIRTYNFPPNDSFDVLMGPVETRGVNGIKVGTLSTGSGGSIDATFNIPSALKYEPRIAIRLQSNSGSDYFAYNWFYNQWGMDGPQPGSGGKPVPTFAITGVVPDQSVSITTANFPAYDSFDVLMGYMGTRGIDGIKVDTVSSGSGGTLDYTFTIPPALQNQHQIAIRLQSNTGSKYFAYNWFYNDGSGIPWPGPGGPPPTGYTGYPTFTIANVLRDQSVTIITYNLPPNKDFLVTMGPMGTRGINGIPVTTLNSGEGGTQTLTFSIPAQLYGMRQIAIRLQSTDGSGYYAYNWFYN